MNPLATSLANSPELFPHALDLRRDVVTLLRLSRADYQNASFLDDRIARPGRDLGDHGDAVILVDEWLKPGRPAFNAKLRAILHDADNYLIIGLDSASGRVARLGHGDGGHGGQ